MIEDELVLMMQFDGTQERALEIRDWLRSFADVRQLDKAALISTAWQADGALSVSLSHDGITERLNTGDCVVRNLETATFHVVCPEDLADIPGEGEDMDLSRVLY
ncbi:hypothetical protein [Pelagibius sp. Alg239-R121]|uniref:hypothetical protein n=1 Tax=Pelagibius sp. Alg239-R121 TaxID=2993448 RepID=UPI0024A7461D|nr:hypothetical protein [Pelagibius sp. Alg239-R121]